MFFFRHPRPVGDNRPVAVQIVNQKQSQAVSTTTIIVEKKERESAALGAAENTPATSEDEVARKR